MTHLRQVSVLVVNAGHAVQPGLAQLGRAGVGLGQAVLQVHQHLRVLLMLLHLLRGHQHRPDPLGEVLHVRRERGVLRAGGEVLLWRMIISCKTFFIMDNTMVKGFRYEPKGQCLLSSL